jgi:hypothetical protein
MRFGRRPLLTQARTALETQVIEEVVRAAMSLAQKRVGALIVFERDALLGLLTKQTRKRRGRRTGESEAPLRSSQAPLSVPPSEPPDDEPGKAAPAKSPEEAS